MGSLFGTAASAALDSSARDLERVSGSARWEAAAAAAARAGGDGGAGGWRVGQGARAVVVAEMELVGGRGRAFSVAPNAWRRALAQVPTGHALSIGPSDTWARALDSHRHALDTRARKER